MAVVFKPRIGDVIRHAGERYILVELISLSEVLCRKLSSKETLKLPTLQIGPDENQELVEKKPAKATELAAVLPEEWNEASKQMDLISVLAEKGRYQRTSADVEASQNN